MTTMASHRKPGNAWFDHIRLVRALALKDIVDGVRQKNTLTTIVISVMMVAFYRYLPVMTANDGMGVWVYAENGRDSAIVAALERSPALQVRSADSEERVINLLRDTQTPELGIVIPASLETAAEAGEHVELKGLTMRWLSDTQRSEVKALIEEELAISLGHPVEVGLAGNEVDLHAAGDFFLFSASVSLVFLVVMVGISLVPNLMLEEKRTGTLDVLMVSPARASHVVAGKGVAGVFYGLIGCAVVFATFRFLIVNWPLAIAAALVGTLFMSSVGLLLGSMVTSRAQLQLIGWLVAIPLMLPIILVFLKGLVPEPAIAAMQYVPTVVLARVFRLSFTVDAGVSDYGAPLLMSSMVSLIVLVLVALMVRRQDRA